MKTKIEFLIIFCLILMIYSPVMASAREITVDDNPGADFVSIQEAVNNSVSGDKIIVKPGTYTENVLVNISGISITSEPNNGDVLVKPLNESLSTFMITADHITISGLNIKGPSQDYEKSAIYINSEMNNLTGNTIINGCIVLAAERARTNLVADNKISNSKGVLGIFISCCGDTNIVSNNSISNCSIGIYVYDQAAHIRNNRITDCDSGILLHYSSSKTDNNTISKCNVGIELGDACSGDIINNTILSCSDCGIFDTSRLSSKRIYNNYFNNSLNVKLLPRAGGNPWNEVGNIWNYSLTRGTNIVGGPYIGGNFWAKPDGTGFSQISLDLDGNGIGDLPYKVYEDPNNTNMDEFDYLPLVSGNSYPPFADFSTNVTSGYAPLAVQFTDLSENSVGRSWDFNNDWQGDSGDAAPVYVFTEPGSYNVNLVAINENGTTTKTITITVLDESSSGGNRGGSAGVSPELQNNIAIKELSQTSIFSGQTIKFEFPQKVTAIESITFDSKKTVGKTTTIVEMLKNKSTLVSEEPADEVYKYLNIWVGYDGYATEKDKENAVVCFKVAKSWVNDKKIDKSSITLNRYSDKTWNALPTSLSSEDDNYLYFTAQPPGFSPFAITGKSSAIQPVVDKSERRVNETPNNVSGSTAANNQTPEQKGSPTPSTKQSTSLPGFEVVFGVAGLVVVFLYTRK